jgi:pimeloyl-ACP methyl ester carboxylesterase
MVVAGLAPTEALVKQGKAEESVERFLRKVALGDAGYAALPDWVKEHMRLNIGTHLSQFRNRGGFIPFTKRDARSVAAPTLVMKGEQSPTPLRVLADRLAKLLPAARTVEIPHASHVMHVANPDATARAILDFLAR